MGAGQMNRVGSAKIALEQAGEAAKGAVLASDAFFPFGDTVRHRQSMVLQPLFNRVALFETKNPSRLPTKRAFLWYLQAFVTLKH